MNMTTGNIPLIWNQKSIVVFFTLGLVSLLVGISYYLYFRPLPTGLFWLSSWLDLSFESEPHMSLHPSIAALHSIPTFLYVIAFSFLTITITAASTKSVYLTGTGWFLISCIFEFAQSSTAKILGARMISDPITSNLPIWLSNRGTFDWNDLVAAAIAALIFIIIANCWLKCSLNSHRKYMAPILPKRQFILLPILLAGILAITGSYSCESNDDSENKCIVQNSEPYNSIYADPIYMSYAEFRTSAIYTEQDKALTNIGKIYVFNELIFINTPNEGVHIYDNRNPLLPTKITFINIPGNIDIAIHQNYLYVDSYIDLITIDIHDILNPTVVNRQIDIFPYDAYQNIPENIVLNNVDKRNGIIVGYTEK